MFLPKKLIVGQFTLISKLKAKTSEQKFTMLYVWKIETTHVGATSY